MAACGALADQDDRDGPFAARRGWCERGPERRATAREHPPLEHSAFARHASHARAVDSAVRARNVGEKRDGIDLDAIALPGCFVHRASVDELNPVHRERDFVLRRTGP